MHAEPTHETPFVARLLHRWLVQYNPLYLLSAALVLFGLTLVNRGLAHDASMWGQLAVGIVTELYASALIAAAALLTRLGLRRPAVFVALMAVLYQGDLALQTETFALLGDVGRAASALWWIVFVAKLRLLAWALDLRVAPSGFGIVSFGALGLAAVPHLSRLVSTHTLSILVGLWLFTLLAAALWTTRAITSERELDAWGHTVLRRSVRASWTIWAALTGAHVVFWTSQYNLRAAVFAPVALLLATRWVRSELGVLTCVSLTLGLVATALPDVFQVSALMSAIVLTLHALRKPTEPCVGDVPPQRDHYRATVVDDPLAAPLPPFARSASFARQLAWAGYALYLAAWTISWKGGPWPAHLIGLDLFASASVAVIVWRSRCAIATLPLAASYLHWSIQARLLSAPQSTLQWGVTTVSAGFALLVASLLLSVRLEGAGRSRRSRGVPAGG